MRELERLSRERLPQAMDLGQERARRVYKVARSASAIAQSAEQLEGAIAGMALSAAERQVFAEHADALRVKARELAQHAHQLSPAGMDAQAAALQAICTNCHHRFRIKGVR